MELFYSITTNPFFWALVSMFGLLGASTVISNKRAYNSRMLSLLSGMIFLVGRVMLVLPICPQPRFTAVVWHWVVGGLLLAAALVFIWQNLADSRLTTWEGNLRLQTKGLYSFVRNPYYFGEILFSLGLAVLFRSIIGLALVPVWWAGLTLHILIEEESMELLYGPRYMEYKKRVKGRMIPIPPFTPEPKITKYPFKNLVFKGGGVKGAVYTGVLEILEENDLLSQIDRVAGASAGAITAALISFRLDIEESVRIMNTLDYSKVPQLRVIDESNESGKERSRIPQVIGKELNKLTADMVSLQRLVGRYGWYTSDYFYRWLQGVIADQCDGNGMATFAEFRDRGFRDLYVVAANVSKRQKVVFCADDTPNVAVADAVRMSMSIPLYFESIRFDGERIGAGDYFVDGGLLNNYPIQIFDDPRFGVDNVWYRDGINWETLGSYIFIPENEEDKTFPVKDLRGFIAEIFECYNVGMQIAEIDNNKLDQRRTVMISSCGVQPTEFDINTNGQRYKALVAEGRRATEEFLKNYKNPAAVIEE